MTAAQTRESSKSKKKQNLSKKTGTSRYSHLPPWISAICAVVSIAGGVVAFLYSDPVQRVEMRREMGQFDRRIEQMEKQSVIRVGQLEANFATLNKKYLETIVDINEQFQIANKQSRKSRPREIVVPIVVGNSANAECEPGEFIAAFQIRATTLDSLNVIPRVVYTCAGLPILKLPRR